MKNSYRILVFLILSSFALHGQNVYQHFSELKGMEDYNGIQIFFTGFIHSQGL